MSRPLSQGSADVRMPAASSDTTSAAFARFLLWERSSRDTLEVKRTYIDMAQDLVAGIVLSQIVYWHLPDREGATRLRVQRDDRLWLAKARTEWWDECRVTPKQVDRALETLRNRELIETRLFRFNGAPTVHIRLNQEAFMARWEEAVAGAASPDLPQTSKSISPFGPNPSHPEGEIHLAESAKSITETTAETTSETTTTAAPEPAPSDVVVALVEELERQGVSTLRARDLAARHGADGIRAQIAMLSYRNPSEPAAMLVPAIEENWAPPDSYRQAVEERRKAEALAKRRAEEAAEEAARQAEEARRQSARNAWLAKLGESERNRLNDQAVEQLLEKNPGLRHSAAIRRSGAIFRAMVEGELNEIVDARMEEQQIRAGGSPRT